MYVTREPGESRSKLTKAKKVIQTKSQSPILLLHNLPLISSGLLTLKYKLW